MCCAPKTPSTRWKNKTHSDRLKATEKMRAAAFERFEEMVEPDGVMTPAKRRKCAKDAQLAHMQAIAFKRSKAKRLARKRGGGCHYCGSGLYHDVPPGGCHHNRSVISLGVFADYPGGGPSGGAGA